VALVVSGKVFWLDIYYAPFIDIAISDQAVSNQVA